MSSIIQEHPYIKRLSKERNKIIDKYNNCELIIDEQEKLQYKLNVVIDNKHTLYIVIPKYFPFKEPNMYVNEQSYYNFLKLDNWLYKEVKQVYNIECLCCNTILCPNKWRPALRLYQLVDEFMLNRGMIYSIYQYKYLCILNILNHNILPPEILEIISSYLKITNN